ncbi:hypothetical protein CHUAL_006313 [Chamberlinius hualienensis]
MMEDVEKDYAVCNTCESFVSYPPAHGTSGLWKHKCVKQEQAAAAAKNAEGEVVEDVIVPLPKKRQRTLTGKGKKLLVDPSRKSQLDVGNGGLSGRAAADISEFDAFGIFVSKKLQRMDQTQAIYAESLINTVLRRGQLTNLTANTEVTETEPAVQSHIVEYGTGIEFQES